ncbi:MAG: type I-MYXAN CRISPR-associated protein Cmx8 [Gemmatimonadaceae bacterium]
MVNTKKTGTPVPASVSIRYNLVDLPTAQHKAGLAGLLLEVESMRERGLLPESIPQVELLDSMTAEATFTATSLRGLFDDLYDAKKVLVESSSKWPGTTPVEQKDELDSETGKTKKVFVYEIVQPQGHFLRQFTDDGKETWHKLWRDMLWAIPRGKPTTRGPFNKRAAGESSGEGEAIWKELLTAEKAKKKNEIVTCEVAGAILLGAQAKSAESVSFRDRVDHALLLHFWQLAVRIFVPEQVGADGKRKFAGYVIAIPEVANLRQFNRRYTRALRGMGSKRSGYYPAEAVISLPAQGALEFMDSLARLAGEATSADSADIGRTLASVEFFHMVKAGNNVKTMVGGRVTANSDLLGAYEQIKRTCRNPSFVSARLLALLRDKPWYAEFATMMAESPWPMFVKSQETPRMIPSFAWDARQRFESLIQAYQHRKVQSMSKDSPKQLPSLENLVYRLVRSYVRAKTEQKSGITYASFKGKKVKNDKGGERIDYPRAYMDAQEKVCSDLFLGMRSRRDTDFVSYFTGTVGSIAQGPTLSNEADFRVIAEALLDENRRSDVQTLAMLATAAASYGSSAPADEENQTEHRESAE